MSDTVLDKAIAQSRGWLQLSGGSWRPSADGGTPEADFRLMARKDEFARRTGASECVVPPSIAPPFSSNWEFTGILIEELATHGTLQIERRSAGQWRARFLTDETSQPQSVDAPTVRIAIATAWQKWHEYSRR